MDIALGCQSQFKHLQCWHTVGHMFPLLCSISYYMSYWNQAIRMCIMSFNSSCDGHLCTANQYSYPFHYHAFLTSYKQNRLYRAVSIMNNLLLESKSPSLITTTVSSSLPIALLSLLYGQTHPKFHTITIQRSQVHSSSPSSSSNNMVKPSLRKLCLPLMKQTRTPTTLRALVHWTLARSRARGR